MAYQGLSEGVHDELLLPLDILSGVLSEVSGQLELDGSTSGDHGRVLHGSPHDHDGVVQRPFGLRDELFGSSSQDDGGALALLCNDSTLNITILYNTLGQLTKRLYLSAPNWISLNSPQVPKTSGVSPLTVLWITAPVALATLVISSYGTLPAQKRPLSAKYWVARSPIGSLERTI